MTCCMIGHHLKGFPFDRTEGYFSYLEYLDQLYKEIKLLIEQGCHHFISGIGEGADIDFANYVLFYRNFEQDVTLEIALPSPIRRNQAITPYMERHDDILIFCDFTYIACSKYQKGCVQQRNRYMVDKADVVLAGWNRNREGGIWDMIQYAQSKGKSIRYIILSKCNLICKDLLE